MNKIILMGRLTRDPSISYTQANSAQESTCVARYSLAVDRKFNRDGERKADFISCVAFGHQAEFTEKYLRKGTKIALTGRIQKVYTTDVVVEEQEFAENKRTGEATQQNPAPVSEDGFMTIPDGLEEELPFS